MLFDMVLKNRDQSRVGFAILSDRLSNNGGVGNVHAEVLGCDVNGSESVLWESCARKLRRKGERAILREKRALSA